MSGFMSYDHTDHNKPGTLNQTDSLSVLFQKFNFFDKYKLRIIIRLV